MKKAAPKKAAPIKRRSLQFNTGREDSTAVRQVKYLDKIVEQDHRAVKRVTGPMLNFNSFRSAGDVSVGIELMHMIRTGQMIVAEENPMSVAEQFYALAG